jgi:arylsulfatase A-like enzyme
MYEESLKTPLLVRWPGVAKAGSINNDIVSNLDFAETFLDAAGVKVPEDMQGRSLVSVLKGKTPDDWRKSFYYHYYEFPGAHSVARHFGVTTGEHKLIHFYHKDEWELFDLKKDPEELKSVYGNSSYSDVEATLKKEMERLRTDYKLPASEERPGPRRPKKNNKNKKPKPAAG